MQILWRRRCSRVVDLKLPNMRAARTATATKTSLENKHLENGDYFVSIAFSYHPLLLTENAGNGLLEASLK